MLLKLDGTVPDFTADATGGEFSLAAKRGKTVVLYFYPKDDTPGCTTEGANFAAAYGQFATANAIMAEMVPKPYPARSTVGVSSLPRGAQFEVEAILVL